MGEVIALRPVVVDRVTWLPDPSPRTRCQLVGLLSFLQGWSQLRSCFLKVAPSSRQPISMDFLSKESKGLAISAPA